MVDELDIFAGSECPVVGGDFIYFHAAVKLGDGIVCSVSSFGLPGVINIDGLGNLLRSQEHLLFAFAFHRVFIPLAQVHKENFVLAVAQISAVIGSAFFVLVQNPQRYTYIRSNEKFARQHDDGFDFVILYKLLANL